ncbi:MAG: CoB--CoM heterodisulfide reductase iron-sulfur subunit B family protein [Chloroflexota bacterium]|nr:CoB--CoM heterodisulfide reductase iron-sulfur subunit B family protein [Chloroflexota bacterium]
MRYSFFPGCTQESTEKGFGDSTTAVCRELGIELEEIPDWNCCGASSGHFLNDDLSHALPARNLAIAEREGLDTAVVCAACYLRLRTTEHEARNSPEFRKKLEDLIGMPYEGKHDVRHLLDILINELGTEEIEKKVKHPLTGLKVAAYYGCYLVRPPKVVGFDDPENPTTMDRLLQALGAEVVDWAGKVDCCGGSLTLTRTEIVENLVQGLADSATQAGAEAIVVACPMCFSNLDSRQTAEQKLPILYFTELMGLAFGVAKNEVSGWFHKHFVSPVALLASRNLI